MCPPQLLEKKEVRVWKRAMRPVAGLTLCGKRIVQHCDTDRDTRISQTEWTHCLGVAMGELELEPPAKFLLFTESLFFRGERRQHDDTVAAAAAGGTEARAQPSQHLAQGGLTDSLVKCEELPSLLVIPQTLV